MIIDWDFSKTFVEVLSTRSLKIDKTGADNPVFGTLSGKIISGYNTTIT